MTDDDRDALMRLAAFEHVRRLREVHDHLTATELKPGFVFDDERIPLINPMGRLRRAGGKKRTGLVTCYHDNCRINHRICKRRAGR